jgi:colicin import membrane protein
LPRYMPRKLKTYQTSQGFYDLAVAAPSMKAALAAWGTSRNLFHQGFAKETDDSEVIAAAMAKPGVVLQRPVGSDKPFREHAELPTAASLDAYSQGSKAPPKKARSPKARKLDERAEHRAAVAFEKEERKREKQRQKEEAAAAKVRARRKASMEKAERALEDARRDHDERAALIEKDREVIERRAEAEQERWQKCKSRLEAALRKAGR